MKAEFSAFERRMEILSILMNQKLISSLELARRFSKTYIDGFGYVAPSKTKTIIVDSAGDINKMVGTME